MAILALLPADDGALQPSEEPLPTYLTPAQLQRSTRAGVSLGGKVWEIGFLRNACQANPSEM